MLNFMSIFKKSEKPLSGEWAFISAKDLWQLADDDYYQLACWYPIYDDNGENAVYYQVKEISKVYRFDAYNPIVDNRMGKKISLNQVNGSFQFYVFVPQNLVEKYGISE